jgi:hypothetical protein
MDMENFNRKDNILARTGDWGLGIGDWGFWPKPKPPPKFITKKKNKKYKKKKIYIKN